MTSPTISVICLRRNFFFSDYKRQVKMQTSSAHQFASSYICIFTSKLNEYHPTSFVRHERFSLRHCVSCQILYELIFAGFVRARPPAFLHAPPLSTSGYMARRSVHVEAIPCGCPHTQDWQTPDKTKKAFK